MMPFDSVQIERVGSVNETLSTLVQADGSAAHPYLAHLARPDAPMRDLADAIHQLAHVHARHPGMIDRILDHRIDAEHRPWIEAAARGFARERVALVQLVAAVGPLPSTPGQAETEAAIAGQIHALDMLAQSARIGCANGAAVAKVLDWIAIRGVLDRVAARLGCAPATMQLPTREADDHVLAVATSPAAERALMFGAQQLLAQHRGLWDLLEARASARDRQ